ncbi:GNAT family N-acetyltransferase [Natronincola ferrireducens]|uniref:Acetyltransferase (GNAT) domain-containing protein n=1 Tax=Natronincola ferrireducens TaxID=393762 RepID=A0A1G9BAS7_9FIRM|nr:GNAT family N-acetyltransferase [Natronincola ferrireducens]SDK36539.1 Acetyltransferase (GNAT) domain-containing protein [Natronincola ferrireducens]
MVIKHLSESKEHMELVINWLWKEWGNEKNYSYYKSIVESSLDKENLPQTFIALMDDEPVGTVGLWRCDLMSRQDLFPWLACLYVLPEYRGKGIGLALQRFLIKYSGEIGYKEIFLYTELDNYYEKLGWQYIENGITNKNEIEKIYKINTKPR